MRYVRLFVALLAACVFIVPAFSMPDNGIASKECAKQMDSPCQQPLTSEMAPDLSQQNRPDAMADNKEDNLAPRSMMDDGQNPCGENRQVERNGGDAPRSMMDGKQPGPFCERAQAGQDDKFNPKNMMDGRDCPCGQNQRIPGMGQNMDSVGEFPK